MPYAIHKNPGKETYRVVNKETGEVHAKSTTKEKAQAQIRAMHANEKGGGKK